MADKRWVGVYSSRREMRSTASGEALRNTYAQRQVELASEALWAGGTGGSFGQAAARRAHLGEGMWLDLGKLVLHVVRVHGADLFAGRGAEHLDNLDELINARLAGEERLTEHQLGHDAAGRPHVCEAATGIPGQRCGGPRSGAGTHQS